MVFSFCFYWRSLLCNALFLCLRFIFIVCYDELTWCFFFFPLQVTAIVSTQGLGAPSFSQAGSHRHGHAEQVPDYEPGAGL